MLAENAALEDLTFLHCLPLLPQNLYHTCLRYYPFMKECFDLRKKPLKKGVFSLINDMDFELAYQRKK